MVDGRELFWRHSLARFRRLGSGMSALEARGLLGLTLLAHYLPAPGSEEVGVRCWDS